MERQPQPSRSNTSKLPVPGSGMKRAHSPAREEISKSKKPCVVDNRPPTLTKQVSSSALGGGRPTSSRLASAKSSGNLLSAAGARKPASRGVAGRPPVTGRAGAASTRAGVNSVRPGAATAPRPVQAKPSSAAAAASLNSTVLSTGPPKPKKRPAWDLKGRLQDMENMMHSQTQSNTDLQTKVTEYNFRIAHLENVNQKLSGDVEEKQMASQSAVKEIGDLREKIKQAEEEHEQQQRKLHRDIDDLQEKQASLTRQKTTVEGELVAAQTTVSGLQVKVAELTSAQSLVAAQLENTKQLLTTAQESIKDRDKQLEELRAMLEQRDEKILQLESKERVHETERRRLHNQLQELKGNIRVFCRVRPLLGDEELGNNGVIPHMAFPDLDQKVLQLDKLANSNANESMLNSTRGGSGGRSLQKYDFNFDRVFEPQSTQGEVFEEISQLVQSALDGYNVCIFAYGQTGSGKTYTMEGCLEDDSTQGMIPRTVQQIFAAATELRDKGWQYTFEASMLEIYNENLYDLLRKGSNREEKLEIKIQAKGEDVHVPKLTVVTVTSEAQVLHLLRKASENRSVAETKCNARSSRSHSVFQLRLVGSNSITGESSRGLLNLVDLAGSERVKASGSEGTRLVEANAINTSLSNLGNVIMALGNKDNHIPYRNSKLTYLLQNSLGGNSKTLMFVNVSPKEECFSETLNSLRFATKVNQCNIGTAQKKSS